MDIPSPDGGVRDPSTAASVADGVLRRLDPRYVAVQRRVGWYVTASLATLLLAMLLILGPRGPGFQWMWAPIVAVWTGVVAGLAWLGHRWPVLEFERTFYKVDDRGLELRQGVIWRSIVSVPRSRVQHIDVSQGPIERAHGIATLSIHTAGTQYSRVNVPGLAHADALAIRDYLLPQQQDDGV